MSLMSVVAIFSAALAAWVALFLFVLSRAPGWGDLRWFSLVAVTAAGYAMMNVASTGSAPDAVIVWTSRVQLACAVLHAWSWLRYSRLHLGRVPGRLERAYDVAALLATVASLVPGRYGGAFGETVFTRRLEWLSTTYHDMEAGPVTALCFGVSVLGLVTVMGLYVRAMRQGQDFGAVYSGSLGVLLLMGVNDMLAASQILDVPYLGDVGFMVPVGAVAWSITRRFAHDARALVELRGRLELLVEERTAELTQAKDALVRSEQLAALGQFAARVAHEVNNPAGAVSANLRHLSESTREGGRLPPDAALAIRESQTAISRIAYIVRQLLDASRTASNEPLPRVSVDVANAVRDALALARPRSPVRIALDAQIPQGTWVFAQEQALVQVLVNLVVNAVQAMPADRVAPRVLVEAARTDTGVRITVADNGAGMPPETLRRAFEPFFTTKPVGVGTGLGLTVTLGLLRNLGGTLQLESTPDVGTRAIVTLAPAPAGNSEALVPTPALGTPALAGPRRSRLLLVDDEPLVRSALRRMLSTRYEVAVAGSVNEALGVLPQGGFDVVLCDLVMPDGGGERLLGELRARLPELAERLAFLTGGAPTEAAQAFLSKQSQPVLDKPLDLGKLAEVVARLAPA